MTMTQSFTQTPRVKVNGSALDAEWVNHQLSLSIEMQLQLPTRLIMRFANPVLGRRVPNFPFSFGSVVEIEFPDGGDDKFVKVCGKLHVTEIGVERIGDSAGELVVVAHDGSYWLAQEHRVMTFVDMTSSDVVKKIVFESSLHEGEIEATSDTHKYLLQTDTAAGFISTLARRIGFDWWVDDDKLNFAKAASPNTVELSAQEQIRNLSVSQQAITTSDVTVNGWNRDQQQTVSHQTRVRTAPETSIPGTSRGQVPQYPHPTSSLRVESDAEAEKLASSISNRYRSASVHLDGETLGNPAILPRTTLKITGEYLGGTYELVRVEHRYDQEGYITRFSGGDRVPTGLADFLGANLPQHFGSLSGLPALIPALVTAVGTSENLGRVLVKFPYLSQENTSHWARVLSAGGGPDRGFLFLPEVGDEVLVAFEGGDTRFPVVMGGLHQKVYSAEAQLIDNGKVNSRSIRSRLGHYMDFYDGSSDKSRHIAFGLGKGGKPGKEYMLRIGEDRFDIEVPEGKPIAIKAGKAQITFTADSSIEIKADNISLKAEKEVVIEGMKINLKATNEAGITQGGNKIALAGASGVDIKGAPMTNIKGGPKVNIG